jgi:hypothetical protein
MRALSRGSPALLACLLFLPASSCKLFTTAVNVPGNIASDLSGGRKKPTERLPPSLLQTGVMRFADTFAARVTQASQEFADKADTPEARIQALTWSTGQSTSAYTIATGSNPNLAVLDMIVLVSLGRLVHEEYWLPKVWGEADRPMVEAFAQMEEKVWEVAKQVLSPEQQEAVRTTLRDWRNQHPDMGITAFVKLPVFQDLVSTRGPDEVKKGPNLGDLLSVDPLSGLEPAVRELEQTRLFAERTVFYLQRAPILLQNQVELLTMKLLRIGEVRGALADSERVSKAAESLAATAAALPEAVAREREAAVQQISKELALQRQGLLGDLESAEAPSRKILGEARATLEAGAQMSTALQGAIATLDTFLGRFDKPAAADGAPLAPAGPAAEPGKPFDVSEYGEAATRLGAAAHEIDSLVQNLDQKLPQVQRILDEAAQRGEQTIDHAFVRGLELGLALIAAAGLALFAVRRSAPRPRPPA